MQGILISVLFSVFLSTVVFSPSIAEDNKVICGVNETYEACGSFCVAHCVNRQFTTCKPGCNPGCFCKEDYIRRTPDGPCIEYSDCRFLNL